MVAEARARTDSSSSIGTVYLSALEKIKIRNLYLSQRLTHEAIALELQKPAHQVSKFIYTSKLPELRREREKRLIARADQRLEAETDEITAVIADECAELAMEGLARAKEAVKDTHKDAPKNYQAWTAGVRNLASARSIIKNNTGTEVMNTEGARHLNLFFMGVGVAAQKEKRVDSLSDVL